ncbi:hypothetical protein [Corynebacterium sp. H113]|uniref:hypothetical protein n=1 Tax=Corynebacterium sp. H113 TaxID=3133419 RepID=UPI0030985CE3
MNTEGFSTPPDRGSPDGLPGSASPETDAASTKLLVEALGELETAATKVARVAHEMRDTLSGSVARSSESAAGVVTSSETPKPAAPQRLAPQPAVSIPTPDLGAREERSVPVIVPTSTTSGGGIPTTPHSPPPQPVSGYAPVTPAAAVVPGLAHTSPTPIGPSRPPRPPAEPWWTQEKIVLRVIAIVGGLITTAGILFLVAFAIQTGLLGPLGRVILAYLLAAVLGGASYWAHRRQANSSAVTATAVTAQLTSHVTTAAVVNILEWWHPLVGTVLIFAVSLAGLATARYRESASQSIISGVLGLGFLFSTVNTETMRAMTGFNYVTLIPVAFAVLMFLSWKQKAGVAVYYTSFALLALTYILFGQNSGIATKESSTGVTAVTLAILLILFTAVTALMLFTIWSDKRDEAESVPLVRTISGAYATILVIATVSLLIEGSAPGPLEYWAIAFITILSLGFGALGVLRDTPFHHALRLGGFIGALVPMLLVFFPGTPPLTLAVSSIVAAVFMWIAVLGRPDLGLIKKATNGSPAIELAVVLAALWFAMAHFNNQAYLSAVFNEYFDAPWAIVFSMVFLAIADAGLIRLAMTRKIPVWFGLVGLAIMVLPAMTIMNVLGLPFMFSHMLVSIAWMVSAFILVLSPRFSAIDGNLGAALAVASIAVGKLIFYDMQTLDGIIRVVAFIVSGLLLLAMAILGSKKQNSNSSNSTANSESSTEDAESKEPQIPEETWGTSS